MKPSLRIFLCLVPALAGCNRGSEYTGTEPGDDNGTVTVFEYTPAPGQFIGDAVVFPGAVTTPASACRYAEGRLAKGSFVSLGGFGGYIVVGLGKSIANGSGYDFSISGNQHAGSSEPGVVWVMRDTDGDGAPDDEWYELRGSETGRAGTVQDYWVEYTRPADGADVAWTDSRGASGVIPRNRFHTQPSYYPAWIAADSYTLRGTLLASRSNYDEASGQWVNAPYDWGYADNLGEDCGRGKEQQKVYFDISNAIDAAGGPIVIASIDFIKVQTAVNAVAGSDRLGELSTEVSGFALEN